MVSGWYKNPVIEKNIEKLVYLEGYDRENELHAKTGNGALKIKLIFSTSMFLVPAVYRPTLKEYYACSEESVVDADEHLKTDVSF